MFLVILILVTSKLRPIIKSINIVIKSKLYLGLEGK